MSIVRDNLMSVRNYTPYCGNISCKRSPRTKFDSRQNQFVCICCGWKSKFDINFINSYKKNWGIV